MENYFRVCPYLWNDVAKTLAKMGIKCIHSKKIEDMKWINKTPIDVQLAPLKTNLETIVKERMGILPYLLSKMMWIQ